jgi:hypothetical protein
MREQGAGGPFVDRRLFRFRSTFARELPGGLSAS